MSPPEGTRVVRRCGCVLPTLPPMSDHGEAARRIVVGVDGSDRGRAALARAAIEAAAHGATLEAVHAWNFLDQPGPEFDPHYGEDRARERIEAYVADVLGPAPQVPVTLRLVNDHPAPALLGVAAGAFTLVVGARGLGGFKGLVLGSVSRHVVGHAPCPVLVVH
jgi:nucleotide-binding universal stress UspA family protein